MQSWHEFTSWVLTVSLPAPWCSIGHHTASYTESSEIGLCTWPSEGHRLLDQTWPNLLRCWQLMISCSPAHLELSLGGFASCPSPCTVWGTVKFLRDVASQLFVWHTVHTPSYQPMGRQGLKVLSWTSRPAIRNRFHLTVHWHETKIVKACAISLLTSDKAQCAVVVGWGSHIPQWPY